MSSHPSWFGYILWKSQESLFMFRRCQSVFGTVWKSSDFFKSKSSLPLIFAKSGGIHTVLSLVASAHLNGPCLFRFVEDQLTYS